MNFFLWFLRFVLRKEITDDGCEMLRGLGPFLAS